MSLLNTDRFSKTLALLTLSFAGFAASFTGHLIASNLGTYMDSFGSTTTQIGLVIGSLAIAEVIFKTPFGILADRYGHMKLMLLGFAGLIVVSVVYPMFHDPTILFSIRFIQGIAIGAFSTTSVALVADLFKEGKGKAMGTYNSIKGAGYALGPIAGGLIIQYFRDFNMMFWLCTGVALVCLLLSFAFVRESYNPKEHKRVPVAEMIREGSQSDYLACYFIGMTGMLVFYSIISFLPMYGLQNQIDTGTTGLILGVQAVIYVLAQYYCGKAADKYGSRLPLMVGSVLLTVALLMIALVPSAPIWFAAVVLSGIGIASLWVVSNSYLAYIAPAAIMGTVMGLSGTFKELGDGGGPILVGFLSDIWGLKAAFIACVGFTLVSFLLSLRIRSERRVAPEAKAIAVNR
ncbi:MFS transporter [Methanocella arvoryzae]|uniref:Permease (Major facilitator superfamily) n=1 Tax=Methanocella arvoryzae (strain DSM 22066 / NBRC 105507 / MRE50) TaxID=351160 RepID=Q0W6E0_METAR|nr:MFS transporter [Methanocella arvoryzae]CAJ36053.1 putative permease (major facilitator superfamily) [Methanocella arvoryzae MRE50]